MTIHTLLKKIKVYVKAKDYLTIEDLYIQSKETDNRISPFYSNKSNCNSTKIFGN